MHNLCTTLTYAALLSLGITLYDIATYANKFSGNFDFEIDLNVTGIWHLIEAKITP